MLLDASTTYWTSLGPVVEIVRVLLGVIDNRVTAIVHGGALINRVIALIEHMDFHPIQPLYALEVLPNCRRLPSAIEGFRILIAPLNSARLCHATSCDAIRVALLVLHVRKGPAAIRTEIRKPRSLLNVPAIVIFRRWLNMSALRVLVV